MIHSLTSVALDACIFIHICIYFFSSLFVQLLHLYLPSLTNCLSKVVRKVMWLPFLLYRSFARSVGRSREKKNTDKHWQNERWMSVNGKWKEESKFTLKHTQVKHHHHHRCIFFFHSLISIFFYFSHRVAQLNRLKLVDISVLNTNWPVNSQIMMPRGRSDGEKRNQKNQITKQQVEENTAPGNISLQPTVSIHCIFFSSSLPCYSQLLNDFFQLNVHQWTMEANSIASCFHLW